MIPAPWSMDGLIGELESVLDEEILLLEQKARQLADRGAAILDRDDDSLGRLLEEVEQTTQRQQAADLRLQALRNTLAEVLELPAKQVRLATIAETVDPAQRQRIEYRRQQIILLAEQVQKKHLETALLLSECARINQLMLESLFPQRQEVSTYRPDGRELSHTDASLLDTEL